MTDVIVRLRPVQLDDCESKALDFFSRDMSSVDWPLSHDDCAMDRDRVDDYDDADAAVTKRGMALDRLGDAVWEWLVNAAPADRLAPLPRGVDLKDVSGADYPAIRDAFRTALDGFIGLRGTRRGLAFATKSLHLKRPALLPICDSHTVAMLGIPYRDDGSKAKRIAAELMALDLTWQAVRDNEQELDVICGHLRESDFRAPRSASSTPSCG